MSRRRLPKPTLRKGALTYELVVRVGSKTVRRSLRTRDYNVAVDRSAAIYQSIQQEHLQPKLTSVEAASAPPTTTYLSIDEVCRLHRERLFASEVGFRAERAQSGVDDPAQLAAAYRLRLQQQLKLSRDKAMVHDFSEGNWFLTLLSKSGAGEVHDRNAALMALARTTVATLLEIIANDADITPTSVQPAPVATNSTAPLLSVVAEDYLRERGTKSTATAAIEIWAVARDLCIIAGDKPVTDYRREDARAYKDILLTLAPNWQKKPQLRDLTIQQAAAKSAQLKLAAQSDKTKMKKWMYLNNVFKFAVGNYTDAFNPFDDSTIWAGGQSAAEEWTTFKPDELRKLLRSEMRGDLHWLTWLGLCTGARLNELCQLTTDLIFPSERRIYFSPELRLKTGEKKSCVRSVPMHQRLVDEGFLEFVKECEANPDKKLFPRLKANPTTQRLSGGPSKAFGRHLKRLDIKRPKLSFHSLRHNFGAEFKRRLPRDVETRERLMGHTVKGVAGRYGDDFVSEALDMDLFTERAKAVAMLQFDQASSALQS